MQTTSQQRVAAKEIAEDRTKYMENYLEEFFAEWDGVR